MNMNMNIMHLPYIFSIIFYNKIYEKIIFYLIFILDNSDIEYKNKVITKLYIYLNCYKKKPPLTVAFFVA